MSSYLFIATNYEIPEVDNTKAKNITVQEAIDLGIKPHELLPWEKMDPNAEILFVENEDDLDELVISKETSFGDCGYTSYSFIYEVNFIFSELRAKQLLEYLKENLREGQILELWRVWIGHDDDKVNIPFTRCRYEELSLNHLIQLYNWKHEKYKEQDCLVIEK
jgi:hypothetical protein